jgi:hypothetical protein
VHFDQPIPTTSLAKNRSFFFSSSTQTAILSMSQVNNKESLRPYSMAGSETTTVANSAVPSVMEQKEMATSAAPSASSIREREQSAAAAESTEKAPHVEGSGSISDEEAEDNFVYPKGWQLTIITTALAFSVFCMALVCYPTKSPHMMTRTEANNLNRTTQF